MSLAPILIFGMVLYSLKARELTVRMSRLTITTIISMAGFGAIDIVPQTALSVGELIQFLVGVYILANIISGKICLNKSFLIAFFVFFLAVTIGLLHLSISSPQTRVAGFNFLLDHLFYGEASPSIAQLGQDHLLRVLRMLAIFPFLALFASRTIDSPELTRLSRTLSIFFITIISVELVLKTLDQTHIWLMVHDIFTGRVALDIERYGFFGLQGLTDEPSHLAYLFLPLAIFLFPKHKPPGLPYLLIVLLLLISGSLRNFTVSLFLGFMFYNSQSKTWRSKKKRYFLISLFVLTIVLVQVMSTNYLDQNLARMAAVLGFSEAVGSEGVRMHTWSYAWEAFKERPYFGIGLGSISVYGGLVGVLSSVGIFGTLSYLYLIRKTTGVPLISPGFLGVAAITLFSWNINIVYDPLVWTIFLSLAIFYRNNEIPPRKIRVNLASMSAVNQKARSTPTSLV